MFELLVYFHKQPPSSQWQTENKPAGLAQQTNYQCVEFLWRISWGLGRRRIAKQWWSDFEYIYISLDLSWSSFEEKRGKSQINWITVGTCWKLLKHVTKTAWHWVTLWWTSITQTHETCNTDSDGKKTEHWLWQSASSPENQQPLKKEMPILETVVIRFHVSFRLFCQANCNENWYIKAIKVGKWNPSCKRTRHACNIYAHASLKLGYEY